MYKLTTMPIYDTLETWIMILKIFPLLILLCGITYLSFYVVCLCLKKRKILGTRGSYEQWYAHCVKKTSFCLTYWAAVYQGWPFIQWQLCVSSSMSLNRLGDMSIEWNQCTQSSLSTWVCMNTYCSSFVPNHLLPKVLPNIIYPEGQHLGQSNLIVSGCFPRNYGFLKISSQIPCLREY